MQTWKDGDFFLGFASKYQEKVFMNFFNGIFGQSWVTLLFVIQHLGKFGYL